MPGIDRTTDFREVLTEKRNALPDSKRRKISRAANGDSPVDGQNVLGKEYVAEAYVIVRL